MPGHEPRVVATFGSYAEMLEAIRERVNELQIQGERFDDYAGLPTGYLSKLAGKRPPRVNTETLAPVEQKTTLRTYAGAGSQTLAGTMQGRRYYQRRIKRH